MLVSKQGEAVALCGSLFFVCRKKDVPKDTSLFLYIFSSALKETPAATYFFTNVNSKHNFL